MAAAAALTVRRSPAGEHSDVRSPITQQDPGPEQRRDQRAGEDADLGLVAQCGRENARSVMNRAMVKPTPARIAPPNRWL